MCSVPSGAIRGSVLLLKDASTGNRTSNLLFTKRLLYLLYHCRPAHHTHTHTHTHTNCTSRAYVCFLSLSLYDCVSPEWLLKRLSFNFKLLHSALVTKSCASFADEPEEILWFTPDKVLLCYCNTCVCVCDRCQWRSVL